jgi:hypothetical protein
MLKLITIEGTAFPGCTNNNPDLCACETWQPIECVACDQEIVDGTQAYTLATPEFPFLGDSHPDQEWSTVFWHVTCDERPREDSASQLGPSQPRPNDQGGLVGVSDGDRVSAHRPDRAGTVVVGTLLPYDDTLGEWVVEVGGRVWRVVADSVRPAPVEPEERPEPREWREGDQVQVQHQGKWRPAEIQAQIVGGIDDVTYRAAIEYSGVVVEVYGHQIRTPRVYRICVEVPDDLDGDALDELFAAVADAAHDWEPEQRDDWDINVYSGVGQPDEGCDGCPGMED